MCLEPFLHSSLGGSEIIGWNSFSGKYWKFWWFSHAAKLCCSTTGVKRSVMGNWVCLVSGWLCFKLRSQSLTGYLLVMNSLVSYVWYNTKILWTNLWYIKMSTALWNISHKKGYFMQFLFLKLRHWSFAPCNCIRGYRKLPSNYLW